MVMINKFGSFKTAWKDSTALNKSINMKVRHSSTKIKYSRVNGFLWITDNCWNIKFIYNTKNTKATNKIMKYSR